MILLGSTHFDVKTIKKRKLGGYLPGGWEGQKERGVSGEGDEKALGVLLVPSFAPGGGATGVYVVIICRAGYGALFSMRTAFHSKTLKNSKQN